ncbi:MAG: hypothetical protein JO132_20140 [Streptosporangiaceae bacterium]|nr:hypothetical protein [Streptosporangiaceae bacterium]
MTPLILTGVGPVMVRLVPRARSTGARVGTVGSRSRRSGVILTACRRR